MKKNYQQPHVAVMQVETRQAMMELLSSGSAPEPAPQPAPQRDGFVPGGGVLGGKK